MARRIALVLAVVLAALVSGCALAPMSTPVVGSGVLATEARQVAPFSTVRVASAVRATVTVGPTQSVSVTADDNILSHVVTSVSGSRLDIRVNGAVQQVTKVEVVVTAPTLVGLEASSAGSVAVTGIAADELRVSTESAGTVFASGAATSIDVSASENSTADLSDVEAQVAKVRVESAGRAMLRVTASVTGHADTAGVVIIDGQPGSVEVETDTAGQVIRR
jgi:hypothetical protein